MLIDHDRLREIEQSIGEIPKYREGNYVNTPEFQSLEDMIFFLRNYPYSRYNYYGRDIWLLIRNVLDLLETQGRLPPLTG